MASKKPRTVLFRRRRKLKTDYYLRLKLLLSGKNRLVFRMTNQKIIAQVVKFKGEGDVIVAGADSSTLKDFGWKYSGKNYPAAYLMGVLIAKKALKNGCTEAVFDIGFKSPLKKSKIYAFLKGAVDGGLKVPYSSEEIFPGEDILTGKQIADYASALKNTDQYKSKFAQCLKNGGSPEKLPEEVKAVKQKILASAK